MKNRRKKRILISLASVFLMLVVLGSIVLSVMFQPISKNIKTGITPDNRVFAGAFIKDIEAFIFKDDNGNTLPFLLSSPNKIQQGEKYPLVVYLHGNGSQGENNRFQFNKSLHKGINEFAPDCFVVYPQAKKGYRWDDYNGNNYSFMLDALLEFAFLDGKTYPIDTSRVYIVGVSMGGWGVSYQIPANPSRYAGAAILAGGKTGDENINVWIDVPLWIAHSKKDKIVSFEYGKNFYNSIEAAGGTQAIFDVYEGLKHDLSDEVFLNENFINWLFMQKKDEK